MNGLISRFRARGATNDAGSGYFDPGMVQVAARRVCVGGVWTATLVVVGYPREVSGAGWLAPVTGHPGLVDVSLHVSPIDPSTAASRLRRRLARLESGRRAGAEHGRLPDPDVDAAAEDAQALADRVARGETKLFTATVTVTLSASCEADLDDECAAIRALLSSLLMTAHPTSWRAWHGWMTGLPLGVDHLRTDRILDTASVAASMPFASPDLPAPDTEDNPGGGVLYGHNLASSSLVFWDRWRADNYNAVILGRSGAGKSYLAKLELLRSLYTGVSAHVIDPEGEYVCLADAVGGQVIRLGDPQVRLNPCDLDVHTLPDDRRIAAPDALARRRMNLHSFLALALTTGAAGPGPGGSGPGGPGVTAGGELSASERAVLDEAITHTYQRAGITEDPSTWTRPAPLLRDLYDTLTHPPHEPAPAGPSTTHPEPAGCPDPGGTPGSAEPGPDAGAVGADVARRLRPFVDGAFSGLFDGPTSRPPGGGHLTVWSLRELPDQLRSLATMLVLDTIWRTVTQPQDRRRRMVVVDEAWWLLAHRAGAEFLLRAAKSGRKHWCGLTVATQDSADVLGTDLGRAVITNSATQVLLRQAPQAIDQVGQVFGLSAGERSFLLSAERGEGLLTGGEYRAAFAALASPQEDELITTDPAQLAHRPAPGPQWVTLDPPPHPAGAAPQIHPVSAAGIDGEPLW